MNDLRPRRSEATELQIDPSEAWGNLNGDTREARSPISTAQAVGVRNAHH